MTVIRYPFEMFAELRRDVAAVTQAWDAGRLAEDDKERLRFAYELAHMRRPMTRERMAAVVAIIGAIAEDYAQ